MKMDLKEIRWDGSTLWNPLSHNFVTFLGSSSEQVYTSIKKCARLEIIVTSVILDTVI
jgi:hypothetical protein